MKRLKKLGGAVLTGAVYALFFLPAVVMRIMYRGRVVYIDKTVKSTMKQGAVLIANHKSHADGFFVPMMLFPLRVCTVVTRKWYDKRVLNTLFRHMPYIPIDLTKPDASWMTSAEDALKQGKCVLIFPEGKLEKDGKHEPFRSGFLLPARHLDVSVIPMAITGDYSVFKRQTLIVGKPIKLNLHERGRLSAVLNAASEQCEREVFALAGEEYASSGRNID
ncbi:MAG: 1-acyl-sn-glycerol-3-phosphate acyltransferase [Firmicutes bacterium]|nr:1-acyl-sn-glycerol-3-phosphate acyltransferase [Bacillota bacterium]